jgi:hypothetical protein
MNCSPGICASSVGWALCELSTGTEDAPGSVAAAAAAGGGAVGSVAMDPAAAVHALAE